MEQIWPWFVEAIAATAAGGVLFGLLYIVKLLIKVQHALDHLGPSMQTLYLLQPPILKTLRYQNAAMREIGANGNATRADGCIDEAEEIINRRHANLEMGLGQSVKTSVC